MNNISEGNRQNIYQIALSGGEQKQFYHDTIKQPSELLVLNSDYLPSHSPNTSFKLQIFIFFFFHTMINMT